MGIYSEIGVTGLDEFHGVIQQDFLRELRGKDGYRRFNEMRMNSAVVGALMAAIEEPIRSARWMWESESGEEDPRLEFLNAAIDGMSHSWNDHLSEALTMLPFGYSLFEIVYERRDGGVMWHKFAIRGQDTIERWKFDDTGALGGAYQRAAPTYREVLLPIEKCILYRTRVERNNPEGRSILRPGWISYYYRKNIASIEAIGIERDLCGMPVIKLPEAADVNENDSNSDISKAKKVVRNLRNDEAAGVTLPYGWELELLSTGGSRQFDTDAIIRRYDREILLSALAQFLLLGQDGTGAYALSKDQTDFFNMSLNHTADIIAEAITKFAMPRLCKLNGIDPEGLRWTHAPIGDSDLQALGDFLAKTSGLITWTSQDELWLRNKATLPIIDVDEIEAERQEKMRQAIEIARGRGNQQRQDQGPEDDEDEDQMGAIYDAYAAGRNPPDDAKRRFYERKWQSLEAAYLAQQQKDVMKGVKNAI